MTKSLRLGIAGLGTVGSGVVELIQKQQALFAARTGTELTIIAVSARNKKSDRGMHLDNYHWCDDPVELARRDDIDAVIELIGGADGTAKALCETALSHGKHVITANKALIAHHGATLAALAEKHQRQLCFEAAVAGGIPVIKLMKEGLAANHYERIIGILNGTCNYILSVMESTGRQFEDVLKEAQSKGYAEADPSFDVDGVDAGHKLCILSALAFGTTPAIDGIHCEGIRMISADDIHAASELGYTIRLLAVTVRRDEGIELRVHPALVPKDNKIAQVTGVYNAVHIFGNAVGDMFMEGQGAGKYATASAVLADVLDIARGNNSLPFIISAKTLKAPELIPMDAFDSAYYLRLRVADTAGVLAAITNIFAQHDISVATFIQHATHPNKEATIILTTHLTTERHIREALKHISELPTVVAPPCMIRIEEE